MAVPSLGNLFAILAPVVLFAWLARLAWRSRRIDVAPQCRACGYDVSQRPSGVERCSECGADLAAPGAILTSRRRPNWWIAGACGVAAGFFLLVFIGGLIFFPWFRWYLANAPVSWIIADAKKHRDASGDAYREAWFARGPRSAFFDELLAMQADPTLLNVRSWEQWFSLRSFDPAQNLSDAQERRYLAQILGTPATIRVRTPLRVGDPLLVDVISPRRGTYEHSVKTVFAAQVDGQAVVDESTLWSYGILSETHRRAIPPKQWAGGAALTPGTHRVNVVLSRMRCEPSYPYKHVGERYDVSATLDIDVLPAGTSLGTPIVDPSKADAIAAATEVHVYHWHDGRAFAKVNLQPADVDRAFSIYAVIDGVERKIGSVTARAGKEGSSNEIYVPLSEARATALDALTLVLVGDGEPLAETFDQQAYWAGRILFPDVPLEPFPHGPGVPLSPKSAATLPWRIEPTTRAGGQVAGDLK